MNRLRRNWGATSFSLIELVIVVVIIGVIAAIAAPRLSRSAAKTDIRGLKATLANVRNAIERYFAEHGQYPGYDPSSGEPDGDFFVKQLTEYSNAKGEINSKPSSPYIFGPYLRAPFPTNPINGLNTVAMMKKPGDAKPAAGSSGWVAVLSNGRFGINASDAEITNTTGETETTPLKVDGG